MTQQQGPPTPTQAIVESVKRLRRRKGWSQQRVADEMTAAGIKWDRMVVANLEYGRRRFVTVEELFTLAYLLDVTPLHMAVPLGEIPDWRDIGMVRDPAPMKLMSNDPVMVTPKLSAPVHKVREWIRGSLPIFGQDPRTYYSEVPHEEIGKLANESAALQHFAEDAEKWRGDNG